MRKAHKQLLALGYIPGQGFQVCSLEFVKSQTGVDIKVDLRKKVWQPLVKNAVPIKLTKPQPPEVHTPVLTVFDPTWYLDLQAVFDFVHNWRAPAQMETQEEARRRVLRQSPR